MRYCDWLHSRIAYFIPQISYRLAMYGLRYTYLARSGLPLWSIFIEVDGAGFEPAFCSMAMQPMSVLVPAA